MDDFRKLFLFLGDSITSCGRESDSSLGYGFVKKISDALENSDGNANTSIINRGVSGNRVKDLKARLKIDCIKYNPCLLTIMVGINDCARKYDSNDETTAEAFEEAYTKIVGDVREKCPDAKIILMEPFLLPLLNEQKNWREDLDPKIHAVRRIAASFKCGFIPLDGIMAQAMILKPIERLTYDGVHLYDEGHDVIAKAWISFFKMFIND